MVSASRRHRTLRANLLCIGRPHRSRDASQPSTLSRQTIETIETTLLLATTQRPSAFGPPALPFRETVTLRGVRLVFSLPIRGSRATCRYEARGRDQENTGR